MVIKNEISKLETCRNMISAFIKNSEKVVTPYKKELMKHAERALDEVNETINLLRNM